jgi:hypothetical protein
MAKSDEKLEYKPSIKQSKDWKLYIFCLLAYRTCLWRKGKLVLTNIITYVKKE